ncbi:MAG: dihydrolipoyl dehydrogenase [Clostridia bacterium]|nr:dihydrolipoyl dehydrogenase [Clostridia bacterium]
MKQYDLMVIGGGPAGYTAALKAAQLGLSTALAEKDRLGGTCLNRGCIPTKALLHSSHIFREAGQWAELGLSCENAQFDLPAMQRRKDAVVAQLRDGIAGLLKARKIDVLPGEARIMAPHVLRVGADEYQARQILIATGGRPALPPIPGLGLPGVLTSDDLLDAEQFYPRLVIIGAGVIGMEFASLYSNLGAKVTVIELLDRVLPTFDRELGQSLAMSLKKRGLEIYAGAQVQAVEQGEDCLICRYLAGGEERQAKADAVLVATGRRSAAEEIIAPGLGIAIERGQIVVDECFRTTAEDIYAAGDIVQGSPLLAHAASAQAINAVCAMTGRPPQMDLSVMPGCVFTDPEIALVGLSADEAKARGIAVIAAKYPMGGNGKTAIETKERGFIKLICEAGSLRLLGAQLMCLHASDLINELALACSRSITAYELAALVHPHPTFGEAVREAAEEVLSRAERKTNT